MPETDYSKSIIYKIKCKDPQVKYFEIGGTTNKKNLRYRIKRSYLEQEKTELNKQITANGGFDNWEIEDLEHYELCNSKLDLNQRVEKWKLYRNIPNNPVFIHQNPPTLVDDPPEIYTICLQNGGKLECQHCMKVFCRKDSLKRHLQSRCRLKNNSKDTKNENFIKLEEKCKKLENIIDKLNKRLDLITENKNNNMLDENWIKTG